MGAGALLTLVGTRPLFLIVAAGVLLVWGVAVVVLRRAWEEPAADEEWAGRPREAAAAGD